MKISSLHHISIVAADLDRSIQFYRDLIGLERLERPPFAVGGAWFTLGPAQLHVIDNAAGTLRTSATIDISDAHFAIRVEDFEAAVALLVSKGFREDATEGDPMRLHVIRKGIAGFPQAYLLDPDRNIIEINAEA